MENERRWKLLDHTNKSGGYLRLICDGKRVADFFPFAANTNPQWIREQAEIIVRTMNDPTHPAGR